MLSNLASTSSLMLTTQRPSVTAGHLFAVLQGKEVRRLPLQQTLQGQLAALFESQSLEFLWEGIEVIPFDPSLRPDEDQVLQIDNFALPEAITAALRNPLSVPTLAFSVDGLESIAGLFVGEIEPTPRVLFQAFTRRQMLRTSGLSIILSNDTFRRLEEPGLVLDSRLCAVVQGTDLFIRSFAPAARVLDLASYYREATDEELKVFTSNAHLHCEDDAAIQAVADSWVRRTVAILVKSGLLDNISARKARDVASTFDVSIEIKRVNGREKIVLPMDRAGLKDILRVLNDDYYLSALTTTRYVSHSKRRLPARA